MEHHLKTLPEYFDDVAAGRKPFEVRRDDRPFAEGDTLLLEEWDGTTYTGRTVRVAVTYVIRGEYCRDGYCIMGIKLASSRGDRIRAMPDEEFAEFIILSPEMEFEVCRYCRHGNTIPDDRGQCLAPRGHCIAQDNCDAFKIWLKQPAEEG